MGSDALTDLTVCLHHETDKAVLVSETGDGMKAVWLPKSQCEVERTGKTTKAKSASGEKVWPVVVVTMPEWLAINKGLA